MPIEYLIVWSYGTAIAFLMLIAWSLGFVAMLRRMRLQTELVALGVVSPVTRPRKQTIITNIFDQIPAWHSNRIYAIQDGKPISINNAQTHEVVTLPSRYQHTLLYGDNLALEKDESETHPSPPVR